ncbi:MAG: hypothetical protein JNK56_36745 [Myxococcales bacterium]|nr:hypothetical protein [Myxococcales bacterium]
MNRTTVKLLLSALCLTVACDPTSQVPQQMRGESRELAPATSDTNKSDCPTCFKWSAKPPRGVNAPPWGGQ